MGKIVLEELRLYTKFIAIAVRSRMQYRTDFLLGIMSVIVLNSLNLTLVWVILQKFQSLGGWNFWEIAMLYSMWLLSHSIHATFFWHFSTIEDDILYGRFDQYLLRPCSVVVQFVGRELNYMGSGDIIIGITIFSLSYHNLMLAWTYMDYIFLVIAILSGLLIESSITLIFGLLSFWTGRSTQIFRLSLRFNILTQQYPIDIFGRWYQFVVTGLLPIAFINYYPLTVLLDKPNSFGIQTLSFLSPCIALLLVICASLLWNSGLKSYKSSGS